VERYLFVRRWEATDENFRRAEEELIKLAQDAKYVATDRLGREKYKTPKWRYRWIVSHASVPGGPLPQVIWIGLGTPPPEHWEEPAPQGLSDRLIAMAGQAEREARSAEDRPGGHSADWYRGRSVAFHEASQMVKDKEN
jgi:hypothetical protein